MIPEIINLIPDRSVGMEVGVYKGDGASWFLSNVRPRRFYLVDPFRFFDDDVHAGSLYGREHVGSQDGMDRIYGLVLRRFEKEIRDGTVIICRDTSFNVLSRMENHSLDWVFIDGDHTYLSVMSDLGLSFQKVRPGGLILGHDYGLDDGWWGDDVTRAVDDFIRDGDHMLKIGIVHVSRIIGGSLFALRKLIC